MSAQRARRVITLLMAGISALVGLPRAADAYNVENVYTANDPVLEFNTLVQGSDGALYGTSPLGEGGYGSVFRLTITGIYTEIYGFSGTDGSRPLGGPLVANDNYLYGTTSHGSTFPSGCGTAYKVSLGGFGSIIHNFSSRGLFGCLPT